MNLKPTANRIVVRQAEAERQTPSGIIIPDGAKEKPTEGIVTAVGPEELPIFKVGDRVIYSRYGGTDVVVEGEHFIILNVEDVLATLV